MKKLLLILSIAICTIVNAQQQTFCVSINANTSGSYIENKTYSIIQSMDGGYVIAGVDYELPQGDNAYIAKLDSAGALQWTKEFNSSSNMGDNFRSVIQTTDSEYIAAGCTNFNTNTGTGSIYLVKFDNAGNIQWQSTVGGGTYDDNSIIQIREGGYVVTGTINDPTNQESQSVIVKFDNAGILKWSNTLYFNPNYYYKAHSIIESNDAGFVIVGNYKHSGNSGTLAVKYDSVGTIKWSKVIYYSNSSEEGYSIVNSNDGGYIILDNNGFLCKVDSAGILKWSKIINNGSGDIWYGMIKTKDGGYAVVGYNFQNNCLIKLDSTFAIQWTKVVGSNNSTLLSIIQTKDDGYALAGDISIDSSSSVFVNYVVKLDSTVNGCCSYGTVVTTLNTVTSTESNVSGYISSLNTTNINDNIVSQGVLSNACMPMSIITNMVCGSSIPCNDSVTVNVSNGLWPYTYSWSNGQTTQTATGLCEGTTYTVTVTDASSATLTTTVIPKALTASMTITNATSCSSSNGQITANVSGGTAPYQYYWNNGSYTATDGGLYPSTYTLTVTDAKSCQQTFTATVTCTNGISNYDLQNEFSIYPNPNNGKFNLSMSQLENVQIKIYDVLGELVYQSTNQQLNNSTIDLSAAPNGIYFLQLKTEHGIANKKLIINK